MSEIEKYFILAFERKKENEMMNKAFHWLSGMVQIFTFAEIAP